MNRKLNMMVINNYFYIDNENVDNNFNEILEYTIEVYSVNLNDDEVCIYGYNNDYHTHRLYESIIGILEKKGEVIYNDYEIKNENNSIDSKMFEHRVGKIVKVNKNILYQDEVSDSKFERNLHIENLYFSNDELGNNKVVINYFRNFTTVERGDNNSFVIEYNGNNKYKIIDKDGNEYLRDKIGGDYISIGMYPIILRKRNGNIMYTELDERIFNNIDDIDYDDISHIQDVIDNKLKWINIGNIENIISVVDIEDITNKINRKDVEIHDKKYNLKYTGEDILEDIEHKVKIMGVHKNEMMNYEDIKDIIKKIKNMNKKDIDDLIGLSYGAKGVYKDVGDNKIEIIHSHMQNHKKFSKKMMSMMNILRKYNKKIDHLYNKFNTYYIGNGYYFPSNDVLSILTSEVFLKMKGEFEDRLGKSINLVNNMNMFSPNIKDFAKDLIGVEEIIEILSSILQITFFSENDDYEYITTGIGLYSKDGDSMYSKLDYIHFVLYKG